MSTTLGRITTGATTTTSSTDSVQGNSGTSLLSGGGNMSVGNSAGQLDREFRTPATQTVTAGTPFTINLASGSDRFSNTLGMVHSGHLFVQHLGKTGKLTIGGGTHPVMGSDQVTLQPGGWTVIDNSGKGYRVSSGAVSGVSPVEALPVIDSTGSGTFTLTLAGLTTAAITYSSTIATLITNINAQLDATFGTGNLVASGASLAALVITGSAGNYQYSPFLGHFVATITGTEFTICGSAASGTSTTTTAGVEVISAEADTLTITADVGVIPFGVIDLGRSA